MVKQHVYMLSGVHSPGMIAVDGLSRAVSFGLVDLLCRVMLACGQSTMACSITWHQLVTRHRDVLGPSQPDVWHY